MEDDKDNISNQEIKNIEEFLEQNKNKSLNIRKKKKNLSLSEKQRLALAINNKLNEHIDSYILIGFDVHGNDVIIVNSTNNMENRALRNLIEDFLLPYEKDLDDINDSDEDLDI